KTKMHSRFGVRDETAKCHGYSNEVKTQALLEAKATSGTGRQSRLQIVHITPRAAPESDPRVRLAAQEPDMQLARSSRAILLKLRGEPDCATKLRRAGMLADGQGQTPTQFRSPDR